MVGRKNGPKRSNTVVVKNCGWVVNRGFQITQEKEEAHSPYIEIMGTEKDSVGGGNATPAGDQNTVPGAVEDKYLFRMLGSQWY